MHKSPQVTMLVIIGQRRRRNKVLVKLLEIFYKNYNLFDSHYLIDLKITTVFCRNVRNISFILPLAPDWNATVTGLVSSPLQLIVSPLCFQQKQHRGRIVQTLCCETVRLQSSGDHQSHHIFCRGAGSPRRLDPKTVLLSQCCQRPHP